MATEPRPDIPASLERELMIEAGYRCAICEETSGLDIEHIEDWAEVKEHRFENMIVLCAVCHRRKQNSSDARHINRASLKAIKTRLMMLNGRYSDLGRRILMAFRDHLKSNTTTPSIFIHETMVLLVQYLLKDGLVSTQRFSGGVKSNFPSGIIITNDQFRITLTGKGMTFVRNLISTWSV